MTKYSRQHYREIGSLLGKSKASKKDVDKWVRVFKKDNPRFKLLDSNLHFSGIGLKSIDQKPNGERSNV